MAPVIVAAGLAASTLGASQAGAVSSLRPALVDRMDGDQHARLLHVGLRERPPAWWLAQARCIHAHESRDWHLVDPPYAGGLQFTLGTFNSVGRPARSLRDVARAPVAEQMRRAYQVYRLHGGTWRRDWPNTARACGLR